MGLFDKQKPPQDETQQAAWLADRARIASFLYRAARSTAQARKTRP